MAEQAEKKPTDIVQLWRDWLTESERQFNAFFGDAANADGAARAIGGSVEFYATFQRLLTEGMQRYLAFINMPSRTDVIGLGEALRSIEERLARIEETLQIAAEAVDASERSYGAASEPARTRQPEGGAFDQRNDTAATIPEAIPEELRR